MTNFKEYKLIDNLPAYNIDYREYPYTLVITFDGVRTLDKVQIEDKIKKWPLVKDVYNLISLDDSEYKIGIEFSENVSFGVSEYKNPGELEISMKEKTLKNKKEAYFIRSDGLEQGEPLAQLEEQLMMYKNLEVQKTDNGKFAIQFGPYESDKEARKDLLNIEKNNDLNINLFIEKRDIGKGPK